jgi:hypothetical protein
MDEGTVTMTTQNSFESVEAVAYYFGEHSLGPWAVETARRALDSWTTGAVSTMVALLAVVENDEKALVVALEDGGSAAVGVLNAMNILWATRGF